jgi:flagellar hook protein FlgE
MSLTSTLFTGLSGLAVSQTQLNVVGNNIANANTVGFKSSRALFSSQFYVTTVAGTAPSTNSGGSNPSQLGLGAQVSAVQQDFSAGTIEPTGVNTDMAVNGNGFFVVAAPTGQQYTRDGSFTLNSADQLVSTAGDFVQGFGVDANNNVLPGQLQNITIPLGTTTTAKATANVTLQGNLNAAGAVATGQSILNSQLLTTVGGAAAPTAADLLTNLASESAPGTALINVGDVYTLKGQVGGSSVTPQTFTVTAASTVQDLLNFYNGGLGIDTTVGGTPPPGSTIETSATNPNAATLVVTGNVGTANALSLAGSDFSNQTGTAPFTFVNGSDNAGFTSGPAGESIHTSFTTYDSLGNPVNVNVTAVLASKADTGNVWQFYATSGDNKSANGTVLGDGTLTFNGSGQLTAVTGNTLNIDRTGTGANSPLTITLNFGTVSQLAGTSSNLVMTNQDGSPIGSLNSFSVGSDGTITGAYSNGQTKTLGQVAMATFKNNGGLINNGGNTYSSSSDSGVAVISAPQELGSGSIQSGALELSNVDLSTQFTNLIIASTGYSAASKVITTSDQLLTELLNSSQG